MFSTNESPDKFFLWAMIVLPILSLCAYIFDAFYYYYTVCHETHSLYEGLLSTIVIVFAYLQYCAPIQSRHLLFAYHLSLWMVVEVGHVGYLMSYVYLKKTIFYCNICDASLTSALLYCRVFRRLNYNVEMHNKHIFHFISRLEVIFAIFIPIFINQEVSTITQHNIAFFLLFDFFSEKYERFSGIWIKSCLYLFATTVTVSVASEWLFFSCKQNTYEYITDASKFISTCLWNILVIMQFFTFHFKPHHLIDMIQQIKIIAIHNKPILAV